MDVKNLILAGVAIAFYALGQLISSIGDAAPFVPGGVAKERLVYHSIALILTLAALAIFVTIGVRLYRAYRK